MNLEKNISKIIERMKVFLQTDRDAAIAEAFEMSQSSLSERKRRNSIPYDALIRFCDIHGLSVDWLLTGEGPRERGEVLRIMETQEGYGEPVDLDLLAEVIEEVAEVFEEQDLHLPPEKFARLIVLYYKDRLRTRGEKPDKGRIVELVRLAS